MRVFSQQPILPIVLFLRYFSIHYEPYFQDHQRACAIYLFLLTAKCQTRIYLFVSSKIKTLCTSCRETGTLNLSNYSGCFLIISTAFQKTETAFERCSTKLVLQQNDVVEYSSSVLVVKSRKALHTNLLKTELYHKYFSNDLTTISKQLYW